MSFRHPAPGIVALGALEPCEVQPRRLAFRIFYLWSNHSLALPVRALVIFSKYYSAASDDLEELERLQLLIGQLLTYEDEMLEVLSTELRGPASCSKVSINIEDLSYERLCELVSLQPESPASQGTSSDMRFG